MEGLAAQESIRNMDIALADCMGGALMRYPTHERKATVSGGPIGPS